jgi:phage terminase small subunit
MNTSKLTIKQEAFAQAYIETGNASEAYRRAYNAGKMKPATVNRKAVELLENGKITARIAELQAGHQKRHEVTVDRIVQEYAKIGFANMLDYVTVDNNGGAYVDLSKLDRDQAAAIQEITVEHLQARDAEDGSGTKIPVIKTKFKLADKKSALDSLGKHLGMFIDKHEVAGKDGGPIETREMSDRDFARWLALKLQRAAMTNGHAPSN